MLDHFLQRYFGEGILCNLCLLIIVIHWVWFSLGREGVIPVRWFSFTVCSQLQAAAVFDSLFLAVAIVDEVIHFFV